MEGLNETDWGGREDKERVQSSSYLFGIYSHRLLRERQVLRRLNFVNQGC